MKQPVPSTDASPQVTNPHDKTFKMMFSEKEIAQDVIRVNLPDEIVATLDFSAMELADRSFVSQDLAETFTDVLYRIRSETHDMFVVFLFEHKSSPDKFALLQVGRYIYDIWEEHLRGNKEIPVVVPIVFYHGLAPWNYPTDMRKLVLNYEMLGVYYQEGLPTITHQMIDMRTQDEEFIALYNELTQLIVLVFKHIFTEIEWLLEILFIHLEKVRQTMTDEQFMYYASALLFYIEQANPQFTEEILEHKIKELEGRGVVMMSVLERREQRALEKGLAAGKKEGRKEGIKEGTEKAQLKTARNFLAMGLDVDLVAKGTGLSRERVKELQAEMKDKVN